MVLWNRIKELRQGSNLPNHRMLKATAGGAKPGDKKGSGKEEAEDKLYLERISALPKRDGFLGVQIERDNAQVVMGAKQDVQLLRLQNGTLTIVAPHVNVVTKSFLVCFRNISAFSYLIPMLGSVGQWRKRHESD